MTFSEVYGSASEFLTAVKDCPLMVKSVVDGTTTYIMNDTSINKLFYLLYARYGNSPIANADVNQFKYKVYSIIFQYGPTWEKKLEIQQAVRGLNINDLKKGTTSIYNKALNPESAPSTHTTTEIDYINEQNVSKIEKNDSQAYAEWMSLLEEDVTGYFIRRFESCFKKVVLPERPLLYVEDDYEA